MYACIAYIGALPSVLILASQDVFYKVVCGQSKQKPLAFNRYPTKDDLQMASKHMERCSTSYIIQGNAN